MSRYIERVENLIRVVSEIPDNKFDLSRWYDPTSHCGCAIGHAIRDEYFKREKLDPYVITSYQEIGAFFDISEQRAIALFVTHVGYESRQDVLTALRVLLLEKMAQELSEHILAPADMRMMAELV
jgi:hypothetical protein